MRDAQTGSYNIKVKRWSSFVMDSSYNNNNIYILRLCYFCVNAWLLSVGINEYLWSSIFVMIQLSCLASAGYVDDLIWAYLNLSLFGKRQLSGITSFLKMSSCIFNTIFTLHMWILMYIVNFSYWCAYQKVGLTIQLIYFYLVWLSVQVNRLRWFLKLDNKTVMEIWEVKMVWRASSCAKLIGR